MYPLDINQGFKKPDIITDVATKTAIGFFIAGGAVFAANYLIELQGAGTIGFYMFFGGIAIVVGIIVLIRDAIRNFHERHTVSSPNGQADHLFPVSYAPPKKNTVKLPAPLRR